MDELEKLKNLQRRSNVIYAQYEQLEKETNASIEKKKKEIARLQGKIENLKATFDREGEKTLIRLRKIYDQEQSAKEILLGLYGSYNVYAIGPVLAHILTEVSGLKTEFGITIEFASCLVNNYLAHYYREAASLTRDGKVLHVFAVSQRPKSISYAQDGEGYGTKTTFKQDEQTLMTFLSSDSLGFKYRTLMRRHSQEEVPDCIRDFISFVSDYRLDNDVRAIDEAELMRLANEFLKEYKDKYTKHQTEKEKPFVIRPNCSLGIQNQMAAYKKRKKRKPINPRGNYPYI